MPASHCEFDSKQLNGFRRSLLRWYEKHARALPWRETADPYRIWISEIMLQQTTVVAVVPYFERFLAAFPSLPDLAAADEEAVLRLWEGLGYYSRARNIHNAARLIVAEYAGEFPDDVETLLSLPGIGRYTAGAIVSFAFDRPAPIVEANTLRLYCRLLGFRGNPRSTAGQKLLWTFAEQLLPPLARGGRGGDSPRAKTTRAVISPGLVNQALMELGATICTPTNPACERCPVKQHCAASTRGLQSKIPRATPRAEPTAVTEVAVVVMRDGKYLLQKRLPGERWAGLWDFVRFPLDDDEKSASRNRKRRSMSLASSRLSEHVRAHTGLDVAPGELITELRHTVTRFRITLRCYTADYVAGDMIGAPRESRWFATEELASLPLSMTGRKLARILTSRDPG